jgi:hypothetical protein
MTLRRRRRRLLSWLMENKKIVLRNKYKTGHRLLEIGSSVYFVFILRPCFHFHWVLRIQSNNTPLHNDRRGSQPSKPSFSPEFDMGFTSDPQLGDRLAPLTISISTAIIRANLQEIFRSLRASLIALVEIVVPFSCSTRILPSLSTPSICRMCSDNIFFVRCSSSALQNAFIPRLVSATVDKLHCLTRRTYLKNIHLHNPLLSILQNPNMIFPNTTQMLLKPTLPSSGVSILPACSP